MKVLLCGAGAVGLGIASALIDLGIEVDIIARGETKKVLEQNGLKRIGIFGEVEITPDRFKVYENIAEAGADYDYTLVAVKSFDSETVAKEISENLPEKKGTIVLMQNGWGNFEVFSRYFGPERIYNARIITGFSRPERNVVDITAHADDIKIGSLIGGDIERVEKLAEAISGGGLPTKTTESVIKDILAKLIYNCALNPLGAIFKVNYGKLAENKPGKELIEGIVSEIFDVLKDYGYSTYWNTSEEYMDELCNKLLPLTGKHESSMLQDIRAERRTEIDALNNQVVKLGELNGVDVTVNRTVANMVKFLEAQYL